VGDEVGSLLNKRLLVARVRRTTTDWPEKPLLLGMGRVKETRIIEEGMGKLNETGFSGVVRHTGDWLWRCGKVVGGEMPNQKKGGADCYFQHYNRSLSG